MPASAPGETTMTPALIGLDWGTSALRAYLLAADGTVVDGRTAPLGILKVVDAEFEAVFEDVAGPWLGAHGALPVVASGMIGSRQGWVEAPYVACPAGAEDLARGLVTHLTGNGRSVRFVPGLSIADRDGVPDVMLLPVGGITPAGLAAYWRAGASGFGVGSALYRAGISADTLRNNAETFVQSFKALSSES